MSKFLKCMIVVLVLIAFCIPAIACQDCAPGVSGPTMLTDLVDADQPAVTQAEQKTMDYTSAVVGTVVASSEPVTAAITPRSLGVLHASTCAAFGSQAVALKYQPGLQQFDYGSVFS